MPTIAISYPCIAFIRLHQFTNVRHEDSEAKTLLVINDYGYTLELGTSLRASCQMTRLNTVQLITTQSGAAGDLSLVFDSNYDKSAIGCVRECVVIGRQV